MNTPHDIHRPGGAIDLRWELLDLVFFGYLAVVEVFLLIFGAILGNHPGPWILMLYHLAVAAVGLGARYLPRIWDNDLARFIRWTYPLILLLFCFEAVGRMIHLVRPEYIDPWLASLDRAVFGTDLVPLLRKAARPWLTEIMYFFYASYYFFFPGIGIPLFLRHRGDLLGEDAAPFREFVTGIGIVFLFCYLHWFFTPAGGPVFWSDYPVPVPDLPGGPITRLEQWVFAKGTIVGGAFPSSHVAAALLAAFYSVRRRVAPWFFAPVVVGLGISTVYHGYHYGVDVLYGMVIAAAAVWATPRLLKRYEARSGR